MVRTKSSEGKKLKPRGRPFPKGNKQGKLEHDVLDAQGSTDGDEGGIIAKESQSSIVEQINTDIGATAPGETLRVRGAEGDYKEMLIQTVEEDKPKLVQEDQLIDSLVFKNGENTLSITLKKKHNRMYRIQVFLNENNEIRPGTYTGASPAQSFWNLLKAAVKE